MSNEVYELKCAAFDDSMKIHQIMRACKACTSGSVSNTRYKNTYYNAESSEVYATNGHILLIYKTKEISEVFGKLKGTYVLQKINACTLSIRPYLSKPINYKYALEHHKPEHTDYIDLVENRYLSRGLLFVAECAFRGKLMVDHVTEIFPHFSGESIMELSWSDKARTSLMLKSTDGIMLVIPHDRYDWSSDEDCGYSKKEKRDKKHAAGEGGNNG